MPIRLECLDRACVQLPIVERVESARVMCQCRGDYQEVKQLMGAALSEIVIL